MAKAFAAARSGFRRFFSISAFTPPAAAVPPPKADPSPNLFVSGLSKRTTSEGLREAFSKFGEIIQAKVVTDRVSGYSKGFGFVRYATTEDADEGIKGMDGKFLDGWVIFAEYARPRPPPPSQDQSSQPQSNYGSTNYSSPMSHSPSYYTSDAPSNFSSQASQPPSSNSYNAPQTTQSQSSYYGGSMPPSNYSSQFLQPVSNYASSYFNHSPQTSQPPPNNGSGLPFNYSSEVSPPTSNSPPAPPSWYPSQTTQPATYTSETPNYTQSYYDSAQTSNQFSTASQQTNNYHPRASDPAFYTSSAPNYSTPKSEISPGNASPRNLDTSEPSTSYSSEPLSEYDSGRAANY